MKRYMQAVFGLFVAFQKRFMRDKVSLFFTFLFPLIFLFIFGVIFNNNSVSFRVAILDHANNSFSKEFTTSVGENSAFKVNKDITTIESAKQKMSRGEIDSIVELPESFGAINEARVPSGTMNVYYQKGSDQSGKTVSAVMQQILDEINRKLGRPDAALKVSEKATDTAGLNNFDYTFSGLLGFSLMSMGIFGLANAMPQQKQRGSYKRLFAAPFTSGQLILANAIHFILIAMLSLVTVIIMGLLVFKFNMRGDWMSFWLFALLSGAMTVGFGLLIGSLAKNEDQAAPLANLISFPMMFLSGSFFPRFMYPEWLQGVSSYVPLTPVIDGFRRIMTENASLISLLPEIGLIVAWMFVVYIIAIKFFTWE